ncbi:MAG: hypothetical protein E7181_04425 [Erysipelotrichaceae bacterium]|nr:hypothetical protein [Erysipelotrichaceae bacterium]
MIIDIKEAEASFIELMDLLIEGKEQEIIISKDSNLLVTLKPIPHVSNRIGVAKEEMKGRSITLEEFNSIDVNFD